ncbi:lipid-A-disaccharide synthase [Sneathiella aquimaris]|uniref:lipid-A-disaccharide synthase n=1 Tax=Sneathiella aquimaris TaxID=2599305 RepID=UPI001CA482AE|nr:lipid-A-disaccharide synthase [Sneathiella aquimaris]
MHMMKPVTDPLKIFLVAGEPSGDALASKLMAGLKQICDRPISFVGVGGPLMKEEGLDSLFPMEELTVMGVAEVLPKIPALLKRIKQTSDAAINCKPDMFVTIDAPDFSFRVARKVRHARFPKIHYVAPSVWAWRSGRAKKIAPLYDHLLTILPFEPAYFEKVGLPATFIGHSVIETGAASGNAEAFRTKHGFTSDQPLLMLLPGSRRTEVVKHLPIFKETLDLVKSEVPEFTLVVPVIGKTTDIVENALNEWPFSSVVIDSSEKYDAMAASNIALAASGTVGLELALASLPCVIAYKMHPVTAWIARRLIKLPYVNLVNILEDKEVVPEHILENCLPEILAPSLIRLFMDKEARQKQVDGYASAVKALGVGEKAPGIRAAEVVLATIASGHKPDKTKE